MALSLEIVENLGDPFDAHRATVDVLEGQGAVRHVDVAYPTVRNMLVEVGPVPYQNFESVASVFPESRAIAS